jgi:acyl-CoA reductase-like NAD-dependent aldehyde dehydrogenase
MQSLTVDPRNIFYRINSVHGYIEVVDAASGEVLSVQNDYNENFILGKMDDLVEVKIDDKTILMQKGMNLGTYRPVNSKFSKPLADLILQEIMEARGTASGITKACAKFGVTYSTLMRWAEKNEEFAKELDKAKRYRADKIHDEIADIAHELATRDMNKTKVEALGKAADILKWSAEKSDPNRFGNAKEKAAQGAVQIIIQTGISREEPAGEVIQIHPERITDESK